MEAENPINNGEVQIQVKRRARFKAGSDLSSSVSRMEVDVTDESTEEGQDITLDIRILKVDSKVAV